MVYAPSRGILSWTLHLILGVQFWISVECGVLFIVITPKLTMTRSGSTFYSPIYGSDNSICKLFIFGILDTI